MVDLSGIEFLASMGIRMLVTAAKTLKARGGRLILCGAHGSVAQVLRDTGIDQLIPVAVDLTGARALLTNP